MTQNNFKPLMALLLVGVLMGALDLAIIGPALPAMQVEFDMTSRQLAWLFNIYVLFQLVGTPLLAKLSDRYGRRAIYVFSVSLFAFGSLLIVLAPGFELLMVGRAIQGFGAAGIFPVAAAVIGDTMPPEKRGGALGLLGAVFGIAFLIGPILGGLLLQFSWEWLFLINLPIAACLIFGALRLLPTAGATESKPFDMTGALVLSITLTALAVAVTNFDGSDIANSLASIDVWPYVACFAIALPVFWSIEKRAPDPIVRPSFFVSLQIRVTSIIALGVGMTESASVFYAALAVASLKVSESNAAWLLLPGVLATTIATPIVGNMINRLGTRIIILTGLILVCAGIFMYALIEQMTTTLFIAGGVIGGLGFAGLLGAPLRMILLNEAPESDRAASQGLLTVFMAIGQLLGAAIVGGIAASFGGGQAGYQTAFLTLAIMTGLLAILATMLKSRAAEQLTAGA